MLQTRAWYGPGYGYYSPFYSPGYFYGPGWGLHPYGPWGPYPYYGGYYYRERGSVRLQVKPVETEVYVDGYYAGVVDSYDGFFQRLSLPPGQHDIELRLEGYRSIQEQVYLTIGQSYRIQHEMERLGPGETTPPPPMPPAEPDVEPAPEPFARPDTDRTEPWREITVAGFGRIVVRVQPTDAAIFVDGEEWQSPDGSRLELEVGVGRHRIEVRRRRSRGVCDGRHGAKRRNEGGEHQPAEKPAGAPGRSRPAPRRLRNPKPARRRRGRPVVEPAILHRESAP